MKKIEKIDTVSNCGQCDNWRNKTEYSCDLTYHYIGADVAFNTINENCPLENYSILGFIRIFFNWKGK